MGQMQKILTNTSTKISPIFTFDSNNSAVYDVGYQFLYAIKINPKQPCDVNVHRQKMAAPTQSNSPARNGKFLINYRNCTIGTQVNGDNTTVNNNRPGRSTSSSQESSPIRDYSKSIWSKLLLIICLRMRQWQF